VGSVGWECSVGRGDLPFDRAVVTGVAVVVAVELFVPPAEPGFDSPKGCLRAGQMFTLLGRQTAGRLVEAALAIVLSALAIVRESLARVGSPFAVVGAAFAFIGGYVATIGHGVARDGRGTAGLLCLFGGAAFMRGVLALKLGGEFVVLLRLAVERSRLAMEIREVGICLFVAQPLAAFGGGAFGAGLLARAVAELLCTLGASTVPVAGGTVHGTAGTAHVP